MLVSVSRSVVPDSLPPHGLQPSVHEIFQARILEWVAISFSWDLPNPGIKPGSPALQADYLPTEPQGKPKGGIGGREFYSKKAS